MHQRMLRTCRHSQQSKTKCNRTFSESENTQSLSTFTIPFIMAVSQMLVANVKQSSFNITCYVILSYTLRIITWLLFPLSKEHKVRFERGLTSFDYHPQNCPITAYRGCAPIRITNLSHVAPKYCIISSQRNLPGTSHRQVFHSI